MKTMSLRSTFYVTYVIKRRSTVEAFSVEKLKNRIESVIREDERRWIDVSRQVSCPPVFDHEGVTVFDDRIIDTVVYTARPVVATSELEKILASSCAQLSHIHPAYDMLAGRIEMGRLYKETPATFMESVQELRNGDNPLISDFYLRSVSIFLPSLQAALVNGRDFDFTYDAVIALENYYLIRRGDRVLERPQYMFMRLAIASNDGNLDSIVETYDLLSTMTYFLSHSAMVYAGTRLGQTMTAFSLRFDADSDTSKLDALTQCALTNYGGGSVGLGVSDYPVDGDIQGHSGSSGLRGLLNVLHDMGRRIGSTAARGRGRLTAYIEPWHPDLYDFLQECKKMSHEHRVHTRGVFFGICIPDIFMQRIESGGTWSFFKPSDVPDLVESYGSIFGALYRNYEAQGIATRTLPAQEVWDAILAVQLNAFGPAIVYKDAMNRKSNLAHVACIGFAGQAADTALPAPLNETGACITASVLVSKFVTDASLFDYEGLHAVVKVVTRNLNRMMATNDHPSLGAAISCVRHRAVGIGISGLADAFLKMGLPFESDSAVNTGRLIMETIYHAALETSCELVHVYGVHSSFPGSFLAQGSLQFDLWNFSVDRRRYDWVALREQIRRRGVTNGQLVLLTDTAGSSRLSGSTDGCEPLLSNLLVKRAGEIMYLALNPLFVREMQRMGLWTEDLRLNVMLSRGSVQNIADLPPAVGDLFKTAWEIETDVVVEHAVARGPFVCQSQSIVFYTERPTRSHLSNALFSAWRGGLKTGLYYLRTGQRRITANEEDLDEADEQ